MTKIYSYLDADEKYYISLSFFFQHYYIGIFTGKISWTSTLKKEKKNYFRQAPRKDTHDWSITFLYHFCFLYITTEIMEFFMSELYEQENKKKLF